MIQKFENFELLTQGEIDEKYDGKYVAFLTSEGVFTDHHAYVVAVGDKTDEVFDELHDYVGTLFEPYNMGGNVREASKNRWEDELYVIIRNFR